MKIKITNQGVMGRFLLHLILVLISIFIAIYFLQSNAIHFFLENTKEFFLINSFIAGLFFTSTFTIAPATVALFILGESYNPLLIALVGACGSVVADLIISKIVKKEISNHIYGELLPKRSKIIRKILHTKSVYWFLAIVAFIIIVSPLPDELGISLLSIIHFKTHHFIAISYVLNFMGILMVSSIGRFSV